jgi:hypothetical protein
LRTVPPAQRIETGGTVQYAIDVYPSDVPFSVNLAVINPSPSLSTTLSTQTLTPLQPVTLTVTHDGTLGTQVYVLSITGMGAGFTQSSEVTLLVGGTRLYLPIINRP